MKELADEANKEQLIHELQNVEMLRKTNYGQNELYIFTAQQAPKLMHEVGRLREMTFRRAGGGTGKDVDIDAYDTTENPYYQLIVWEPEQQIILGGYRYIDCANIHMDNPKEIKLATQGLFSFSEKFIEQFLPYTLELGRSFVRPDYQSTQSARKAIYTLDNLWDGLGALILKHKQAKYFFGKVTMYDTFNTEARDLLLYFLKKMFPDHDKLVYPNEPLEFATSLDKLEKFFNHGNFKDDYKELSYSIRNLGEKIPPLINSYMNISPNMRTFGTAINHHFGAVEETGILITIDDIFQEKKERHISL
jgi:hypothetical protein